MEPEKKVYDVAVIGGGVIGLSCVLHLLDENPDLKIAVVDAQTKPGVASRAAAGMLAPYGEFKEESPLFQLCREALAYYAEFLERFELSIEGGPLLIDRGVLIPAGEVHRDRGDRIIALAERYVEVERLKARHLQQAEPGLNTSFCPEAYRVPGGIIDPRRLHDRMQAVLASRVHTYHAIAHRLAYEGGILHSMHLSNGEQLHFGTLLLASGAWSAELGNLLDIELAVTPIKGQVIRVDAPDGTLNHIIHNHDLYLAPRPGAGVLIGATVEDVGFDTSIDDELLESLREKACDYLPALKRFPVAESWCGFRPMLPGEGPLIGWSSQIDNLLLATGHYRNGILLTGITGRMIAEAFARGGEGAGEFEPWRCGI